MTGWSGRCKWRDSLAASLLFLTAWTTSAASQTVEEFYRGKTVRFIIHSTVGGDYDA